MGVTVQFGFVSGKSGVKEVIRNRDFMQSLEDQNQPKAGGYAKYVALGILMFGVGIAGGAYYGILNGATEDWLKDKSSAAVQGEQREEVPDQSSRVGGKQNPANQDHTLPLPAAASPVAPSAPSPAVKDVAPSNAPKISVCAQAKAELDKALVQAQAAYEKESAATQHGHEAGQEINSKLAGLGRLRNEAINNYLTAIAIATSKYNSATSTAAYQVYQQEQASALTVYTQRITEITSQETPLVEQKQALEKTHEEALVSLKARLETQKAEAQNNYETKIHGQDCQSR